MCALAAGVACGGGAPPKPTPTQATLVVAGDANPGPGGPAPVVVRLYQLKEEGAFNDAGYPALMDKEQEALGPSLVAREEYEPKPGDNRTLELKLPSEVHYLGVVAFYRDINNAKWKALLPVGGAHDTRKMTISVGKSEITIAAGK